MAIKAIAKVLVFCFTYRYWHFLNSYGSHFCKSRTRSEAILVASFESACLNLIQVSFIKKVKCTTNMAALPVVSFAKMSTTTKKEKKQYLEVKQTYILLYEYIASVVFLGRNPLSMRTCRDRDCHGYCN